MKILYHHRTQSNGVEGVHIRGVINALRELGHEVSVVALVNDQKQDNESSERAAGIGQRFLRIFANYAPNQMFRFAELLYNFVAFFKIRRVLKAQDIDIIYERYAYFNFAGVLAAKIYKKPLILEVNIFTGLNDARALALASIAKVIERRVFRESDAIYVISGYLKEHIVRAGGVNSDKIFVQPNAIERKITDSHDVVGLPDFNAEQDNVSICFLGRLLPWYKLHELVTVFYAIHKRHPETQLVFIGDGVERSRLEGDLAQLGIRDRVVFCGNVTHEQALAILSQCDIGVIPSTNLWGSPMKLFEYMGTGLPVVAPNIDVISCVLKDGLHGRVFPYDDFKAFEATLEELVSDSDLRKKMGNEAKQHILTNHTWEKVSQHILGVADGLIRAAG